MTTPCHATTARANADQQTVPTSMALAESDPELKLDRAGSVEE
jgi:hypothetical protein